MERDLPIFSDVALTNMRRMVDEVFLADRFHASHKRYLKKVVDDRGEDKIVGSFYAEGTKAALMVTVMEAIMAEKNPLVAVMQPDSSRTPAAAPKETKPDDFTEKELKDRGEPEKPDFNSLKKQYGKSPAELSKPDPALVKKVHDLVDNLAPNAAEDIKKHPIMKNDKFVTGMAGLADKLEASHPPVNMDPALADLGKQTSDEPNADIGAEEDELDKQLKADKARKGRKK